jgi:hypothetical protein
MENEEKKVGCCEEKAGCCEGGSKCEHSMSHCCHNWKKCRIMKLIVVIIALIIVFCLGSQWGQIKSEFRGGNRFYRGGMMNWGYDRFDNRSGSLKTQQATDEVTVKVIGSEPSTTQTTSKQ